jgi:hypothetical protein
MTALTPASAAAGHIQPMSFAEFQESESVHCAPQSSPLVTHSCWSQTGRQTQ